MKAHFASGLAAIVLGALASFPAHADVVTWYFKGVVTQSNRPTFPAVGKNVRGYIRFETQPIGLAVEPHAEWFGLISAFALTSHPDLNGSFFSTTITIDNNASGGTLLFDGISFAAWQGDRVLSMNLQQYGINPGILSSVAIPRTPPPLSALSVATFHFADTDVRAQFSGNITYLSLRRPALRPRPRVR